MAEDVTAVVVHQGSTNTVPPSLLVRLYGFCYYYSHSSQGFVKVPRLPSDLAQQLDRAVTALKLLEQGQLTAAITSAYLHYSLCFVLEGFHKF